MERDNGPGPDHRRADAVRLALDAIEELNETGSSASVMRKLAAARLALAPEAGSEPSRRGSAEPGSAEPRPFGAFAGQFTIGPEFFEPLSRDDLRGWTAE